MKRNIFLLVALLLFLGGLIFLEEKDNTKIHRGDVAGAKIDTSGTPTLSQEELVSVKKVVDGDTIQVTINGKIETIRLIGINTPEIVDLRKPVQCFGKEASNKTKERLTGRLVRLESDPTQSDRDTYKRLLRYVFLENGTLFNKLLIQEGYAYEYTYKDNPYMYQDEFKKAEKEARRQKKGLWADNACAK